MKKNTTVDNKMAQECLDRYAKIYQKTLDKKLDEAYTTSITFNKADLIEFLSTQDTENIKICLGVYTAEFCAQYPTAQEGRLTAFIYGDYGPVTAFAQAGLNDAPLDPQNLGTLEP